MTTLSVFLDVPLATAVDFPLDVFREDPSPQKVCLGHAGCHTDNADEIWIPPVVQKILLQIPQDPTLDHEYIGELGIVEFTKTAMELVIGKNNQAFLDNRAGGVHTIGGTGAVWIGAEFLHRWYRTNHSTPAIIYIAEPQLGTLGCIFQVAGFADICSYRYWDPIKLSVDIDMFVAELQNAPEGSIIFLHAPEEIGLKPSEWRRVASMMKRRHLFPFFDVAAQGLASGDLDRDAWAVRLFVNKGFELFCAQSFSKTFGLYDERVGNLIVVTTDNQTLIRIHSQIARLITVTWLGPTSLGARVITMVLNSPAHFYEWKQSLQALVKRIMLIREKLKEKLRILGTPGSWEHLTRQSGVRSFIGLNSSQVEFLEKHKHIYLLANGQINICSINSKNLGYIAQSIHEAILVTTRQNPSYLCITAHQESEKSSADLSDSP
ncbi:putative aspartate aminotransferase, cytoplasmic 2 [Pseudonaja textilis]|uniref:putative aspartate aminotransferase, cytoplasmic 2 n=1 Tax=Pseudonaja textilis TaxID=8673 RepID=UPI000EA9C4DC|nr:putative aspartate aminotransferase, cytoplasmic 2 [Pseudonaja textilis]